MTANTTPSTATARAAACKSLHSGWALKTVGALAVGALFCFGSTSWAHADAGPTADSVSAGCTAAVDDNGACSEGGANSLVFMAAPLPSGALAAEIVSPQTPQSQSEPRSSSVTIPLTSAPLSAGPLTSAGAPGLADAQSKSTTAAAGGGLTPALAASLVAALMGGSSIPAAGPTSAVKAVPAPVTPAAATTSTVRVTGQPVSSLPGAKLGTEVKATVSCPTGKALVSGGATVTTSDSKNDDHAMLSQSSATTTTTWAAVGVVTDGNLSNGETLDVTAIALCS